MARPERIAKAAKLGREFIDSATMVLTEYRGLAVRNLQDSRRSLGGDATYAVARNTLALLATREAGIDGIESTLVGSTAFTLITSDITRVTKGLRDFVKAHPFLAIKGGILEDKFLDIETILGFTDLESHEALLSKMVGAMKGGLAKAIGTLAAPPSEDARLLGTLQSTAEENLGLIGGAGSASAIEVMNEDAAVGDVIPVEET